MSMLATTLNLIMVFKLLNFNKVSKKLMIIKLSMVQDQEGQSCMDQRSTQVDSINGLPIVENSPHFHLLFFLKRGAHNSFPIGTSHSHGLLTADGAQLIFADNKSFQMGVLVITRPSMMNRICILKP